MLTGVLCGMEDSIAKETMLSTGSCGDKTADLGRISRDPFLCSTYDGK